MHTSKGSGNDLSLVMLLQTVQNTGAVIFIILSQRCHLRHNI